MDLKSTAAWVGGFWTCRGHSGRQPAASKTSLNWRTMHGLGAALSGRSGGAPKAWLSVHNGQMPLYCSSSSGACNCCSRRDHGVSSSLLPPPRPRYGSCGLRCTPESHAGQKGKVEDTLHECLWTAAALPALDPDPPTACISGQHTAGRCVGHGTHDWLFKCKILQTAAKGLDWLCATSDPMFMEIRHTRCGSAIYTQCAPC